MQLLLAFIILFTFESDSVVSAVSGGEWAWISGNYSIDVLGVYGAKGVGSASNYPGARNDAVNWVDSSGSLWLFGGYYSAGD